MSYIFITDVPGHLSSQLNYYDGLYVLILDAYEHEIPIELRWI